MEINEIMENEEVIEAAEEVIKVCPRKVLKAAAGIGLAVLTGVIAYKYVRPAIAARMSPSEETPESAELRVAETDPETDGDEESKEETTDN